MPAADWFVADAWLSDTMSRPVFRWSGGDLGTSREIAAVMTRLAGRAETFFFGRVPTVDVARARTLVDAGFSVVDTGITFELHEQPKDADTGNVMVGLVRPEQFAAVADIAERAFRWSRFHLDPNIPATLANHVKRRWIENYCGGRRGSALYAAAIDGHVAGFLAVIESTHCGRPAATIDLIGVAPEYQGRRAGVALVTRFVSDWRDRAPALRVATQAANLRSIRFYERLGFRTVESNFVLHAHYRNGAIVGAI